MSAPVVKICGVRTVRHAQAAADAGADMVGLIFAPSRRQVTPEEAREITTAAYARRPRFVGVFVDESPETVGRLAAELRLDVVQFSGDERADDCATLRVPFMKVVHVRDGTSADDVLRVASRYPNAAAIVLDAAGTGANRWGGSGLTFDHAVAAEVVGRAGRPILLAGGLRPETVAAAIRLVQPWGVDVSSGVETDGVKDDAKITVFVAAAKACDCGRMAYHGPTAVG